MILISGASGTVGARLVRDLTARGRAVRALVLPTDPLRQRLEALACQQVEGDVTVPGSLERAFEGAHTVYHLAAVVLSDDPRRFERVNVDGTANMLAAAARARVQHFIHVSSASVVYPLTTPYSRSKRAGEQLVIQSGLPFTIARPTLVYERDGGEEFRLFVETIKRLPVVPLIGDGRARKRPVHVDDLIEGLLAIAGNPTTFGQTYDLCGAETISIRELARLVLAHHGMHKPLLPVPEQLCRLGSRLFGLLRRNKPLAEHILAGLSEDADLDPSRARRDLGYRPIGVREGLARRVFNGPPSL